MSEFTPKDMHVERSRTTNENSRSEKKKDQPRAQGTNKKTPSVRKQVRKREAGGAGGREA